MYPLTDEKMSYDMNTHRYVLDKTYIMNNYGVNLDTILEKTGDANSTTLATRFMKRVSMVVYNYIYKHTEQQLLVEYMLAKAEHLRPVILEALAEQALWMLNNGDIGIQAGVDFINMTAMEAPVLRQKSVSIYTEDILENAGILYTGYYEEIRNVVYREDY